MKLTEEPPTETYKYVAPKQIGFCDKCKRPINELTTFEEQRFSTKPEGREWLHNYVEKKLRDSGVIPQDALHWLTERIVHSALRHGTYKQPDRHVPDGKGGWKLIKGKFACIDYADDSIEWHIKCPPPPITRNRFSLKAFIKREATSTSFSGVINWNSRKQA